MARPSARLVAAAALAVSGGFMIAVGGVANHSFLLSLIDLLTPRLASFIAGVPLVAVLLTIYAVSFLIGLGGLTVMMGGLLILTRRIGMGRLFIALGGSAGFLGLLVSFGYAALTTGLASALSHSVFWVGLVLTVLGGRLAKGA